MTSRHRLTGGRAEELLAFLPMFEAAGPALDATSTGFTETDEQGVLQWPVVTYPRAVAEFFRLAAQPWWTDTNYSPEREGALIADDAVVASASMKRLRSLLTYCVRGERFVDGHWAMMIREGRVVAILRRLKELRGDL